MTLPENDIPTVMVALGVTGDLMKLKVIPAMFELHRTDNLPRHFRLIGFSRRDWNDDEFREFIRGVITARVPDARPADIESFLPLLQFQCGEFDKPESFVALKSNINELDTSWGVCSNKIFYLAVSPAHYESIAEDLSRSGLADGCSPEEGWTRVIIEKPFGKDGESAKRLEALLARYFTEAQLYRIDHYLGKEAVLRILDYREAHDLFGAGWGAGRIESVTIRLFEAVGAEKRGAFYDAVGALRDVGQNHALEVLALLAMDRPMAATADAIRERRGELLEQLEPVPEGQMREAAVRAQYDGFRTIEGVRPDSETETYFRIRASLRSAHWRGVPIVIEAGKRLGAARKEAIIRFTDGTEQRFDLEASTGMGEYERLILDAIRGDQTHFVSEREIEAAWRFVDPIEAAWRAGSVPLRSYAPDTSDISADS